MFLHKFYKTGLLLAALVMIPIVLFSSILNDTAEAVSRKKVDNLTGFHYALEIQGNVAGYFTECSGMGSESEIVEHRIVNEQGVEVTIKIPGRLRWTDISCSRGMTSNLDLWEWRKKVETGDVAGARADGSIVMYDQRLEEVARWNFENAWPSRLSSEGNSQSSLEEVTLVYEHIERVN